MLCWAMELLYINTYILYKKDDGKMKVHLGTSTLEAES